MKGIYCVLLLVCSPLLICSGVVVIALAADSNPQVSVTRESEGNRQNGLTPSWVPQPSGMEYLEEQRLLATVRTAQKALAEAPKMPRLGDR